jgi:hypothetical protein
MSDSDDGRQKYGWAVEAVKSLGLPTIFLGIVLYMLWSAGSWAGKTIIVPIFQKQMEFIDQASQMTTEMNTTTQLINRTLESHGQHAIESLKTCSEINKTVEETQTEIKVMRANHDQVLGVLKSIDENTRTLRSGMPQ